MEALGWLLLGLILGHAIGSKSLNQDNGFIARAQKGLKKGQTFSFVMSCYEEDDGDDDDGGNDDYVPVIPNSEHRFN